jgi:hypothetical protein
MLLSTEIMVPEILGSVETMFYISKYMASY